MVNSITKGVPDPSLPNIPMNPYNARINDTHQLLTKNVSLIEIDLGGIQNGYLRLVLLTKQYARIANAPFVCLPVPG